MVAYRTCFSQEPWVHLNPACLTLAMRAYGYGF